MTHDTLEQLSGRVLVLENVMPRIEAQAKETATVLFLKLDDIKKNMVTKEDVERNFVSLDKESNDNKENHTQIKKKIQWQQYQIIELAGLFVVELCIGASKTLALGVSIAPHVIP